MAEPAPTLWSLVGRAAGDAVLDDGRRQLTWGELEDRSNALGHGAVALGLSPGDHVVLVAGNRVEFYEALIGGQRAGMVVSPLKTGWTAEEIRWVLEDAGTRLVVTDVEAAKAAAAAAGVPVIALDEGYEDWLARQPSGPHPADRAGWRMSYTSGTTGRPKGVVRAADPPPFVQAFAGQAVMGDVFRVPGDGPHLMVSRLFHGAPLMLSLTAMAKGASVRILPKWDAAACLDALADGVASTSMVPTMFRHLLALPDERRQAFRAPALRTVLHGGEPCPPDVKRAMVDWFGPVFVEYFGFTEGGLTVATTEEWEARPGTVGRPIPPQEVRILGPDGTELPPRTEGRVYFTSATGRPPFRYLNDPRKTQDAYAGDAFSVGDVGWVDEDGYLYISGREADVIVSAGVNVYPAEVEAVLQAVPAVYDVGVVSGPDAERGEQVVACVVLAPWVNDTEAVLAQIERACRDRLAGYKRPRRVELRDELPRDATGKLLRGRLRAELWGDQSPFAAARPG